MRIFVFTAIVAMCAPIFSVATSVHRIWIKDYEIATYVKMVENDCQEEEFVSLVWWISKDGTLIRTGDAFIPLDDDLPAILTEEVFSQFPDNFETE